jgi:hypothetical protein
MFRPSAQRELLRGMGSREERLVENEKTFRSANERIADAAEKSGSNPSKIPFLCECADDLCLGRVELTDAEYEEVRANRNRFVIIAGHPQAEAEHVVGMLGAYELVEKE